MIKIDSTELNNVVKMFNTTHYNINEQNYQNTEFYNKFHNTKFEHIIHISDIHIRLYEKQDEFISVFNNLYADIEQKIREYSNNASNILIVITGDILHNKTELSPESNILITNFLNTLSSLCPVIFIAGNHDMKIGDSNRLDALSSIYAWLEHNNNNIIYLSNTGLYELGSNLVFGILSVKDYLLPDLHSYELKHNISNKIKILLYHGAVNNSSNDFSFKFENCKYDILDFKDYEYILLGDIHKFQFLSNKCAYAGSLIQNNAGEHEDNHGYIFWDLYNNSNTKFVRIPSPYMYKTIYLNNNKINLKDNQFSNLLNKNIRLLKIVKNSSNIQVNIIELLTKLKTKYKCKINRMITVDNTDLQNTNLKGNSILSELNNIYNIDEQHNLIKSFIKKNNIVLSEEEFNKLKIYHSELYSNLLSGINIFNLDFNIELEVLKFSNVFCFGENNVIDFRNISGINGLLADNFSGKSYILEILQYVLYDIGERSSTGEDILNFDSTNFELELTFKKHNELYKIIKTGNQKEKINYRNTYSVKVDIEYFIYNNIEHEWTIIDSSSKTSSSRKDIAIAIRKLLPPLNIFNNINLSMQFKHTNFIDLSSSDKLLFLSNAFNILFFKDLYDLNNIKLNSIQDIINTNYNIENLLNDKHNISVELEKVKIDNTLLLNKIQSLESLTESQLENNAKQSDALNNILENIESLNNIDSKLIANVDINNIDRIILENNNHIKKCNDIIANNNTKIQSLLSKLSTLETEKNKFLSENILKSEALKYDELLILIKDLSNKIEILINDNNHLLIEYNEHCLTCEYNNNKEKTESNKKLYDSNIIKLEEYNALLIKSNLLLSKYKISKENLILLDNIIQNINTINNELLKLYSQNDEVNSLLDKILSSNKIYENYKSKSELILKYNELSNTVNINSLSITTNKSLLLEHKTVYEKNSKFLIEYELKLNNIENKLFDYGQYYEKLKLYELYKTVMNYKTGVPSYIIHSLLPIIENSMNDILNLIADFNISFDVNTSTSKLDLYLNYKHKSLKASLCSGFEKTITSLAFKLAMIQCLNLPKFIILDEALSSFDQNNNGNITNILSYIRDKLKFIFIISHQENIKEITDNIYTISKQESQLSLININ